MAMKKKWNIPCVILVFYQNNLREHIVKIREEFAKKLSHTVAKFATNMNSWYIETMNQSTECKFGEVFETVARFEIILRRNEVRLSI